MVLKIKKILLNPVWAVVFIVVTLMFFSVLQKQRVSIPFRLDAQVVIEKKVKWRVGVVQSPEDTYKGLGGVEALPSKSGMLFIYSQLSSSPHVMRDMELDLDFIFLEDDKIVFIQEKIPKDFEGIIQSPVACNRVLEVNAGEVEKFGVEVGDEMKLVD